MDTFRQFPVFQPQFNHLFEIAEESDDIGGQLFFAI
jgi:hypothetical protein